jgi:hypothetical protein
MHKKVYILFFNIIIFTSQISFPQQEVNYLNSLSNYGLGNYDIGTRNFFEVSYGFGHFKDKDLITNIKPHSLTEIAFGKRYIKAAAGYRILQFEDNYLFSSYINDNLTDVQKVLNISYKVWRFGLGYRKGFGYSIGNFAVFPSFQLGLAWNQSSFSFPNIMEFTGTEAYYPESDINLLKKFNNAIKFGTTNIAGLDIKISSLLNIGAGYETQVVLPSYIVWKHFGSFFIEMLSQTGIDFLTEGVIIRSVPSLTPIIYFILKNGLSYLFYTLKQEKMNWPFETKAPLTIETVKFNLRINF